MWMVLGILAVFWLLDIQATEYCHNAIERCEQDPVFTRCYENEIMTCHTKGRLFPLNFIRLSLNSSLETQDEVAVGQQHRVFIPSSALRMSMGADKGQTTMVATVINSSLLQLDTNGSSVRGRGRSAGQLSPKSGSVMGQSVLVVRAGKCPVIHLSQPVRLTFGHNLSETEEGTCVFWHDSQFKIGTGFWSADGCETNRTASEVVCTCNHLSFFAVLVNPVSSVAKRDFVALSYITYIGSALSVVCTIISLIIYKCAQEKQHRSSNYYNKYDHMQ